MRNRTILSTILAAVVVAVTVPDTANAADIRVKCDKRTARSSISVDGKNLVPGSYRCQARSGSNQKTTGLVNSVGDELECDFASNAGDVAAGATQIPANFIQAGSVTGKLIDAAGFTVASDTVACRVRR
jgi:hypothetical protein